MDDRQPHPQDETRGHSEDDTQGSLLWLEEVRRRFGTGSDAGRNKVAMEARTSFTLQPPAINVDR